LQDFHHRKTFHIKKPTAERDTMWKRKMGQARGTGYNLLSFPTSHKVPAFEKREKKKEDTFLHA